MFRSKRFMAVLAVIVCVMCLVNVFVLADTEAEAEVTAEALPGYAEYVGEMEDATNLDYAYAYIDSYADAIQNDPDVDENIDGAVAVVRDEVTPFYATIWSIVPAIIASVLALITKEVYSSLFVGIVAGGLLYANFNFETLHLSLIPGP